MSHEQSTLPGKATSIWLDTTPATHFPALANDLIVDVAIVGGGISGLTAATLLKAEGLTVAVLEATRIVEGVTGFTTAKITSQHNLIYCDLTQRLGLDHARAYADANQVGIEEIARLVEGRHIDCDFTRTEAYTYTENDREVERVRAEVDCATRLGLPARFTDTTPLPFSIKAAVCFENQAQFHPRKYLLALAREIPGDGSHLFEGTRVTAVDDGNPCVVTTDLGTVKARAVIIASHFPVNDKKSYAQRMRPHRSYVLALRVAQPLSAGVFISAEPFHSMRSYPAPGSDLIFVGGEGHQTGTGGDTIARYERLERWAREHFDVQAVDYHWSTQDNLTPDGVPYIGRYDASSRHVYVATGFNGWGMTHGTVAAMILRDLILGRDNPWSDLFDPTRSDRPQNADDSGDSGESAGSGESSEAPDVPATVNELQPDQGAVIETPNGKAAVYKANGGSITCLSPVCTHMGCAVQWNAAEKSWDCSCHGSRFDKDGRVLHGPALAALPKM